MSAGKIAVFGVPTAAGGRRASVADAPFRLREAGLLDALRATGAKVVNLSDLSLFPFRDDPEHPRARNTDGVVCALRAAADEMTRALAEGFTIVLGGDCTLAAGVTAGTRRHLGQPPGIVFIDADADLNTEETTPSGFLHGMALSLALGQGPEDVVDALGPEPPVEGDHAALVGFRALDPGERRRIGQLGLALPADAARRIGMRTAAALALEAVENGDGPIVVHLDVDVIDPSEMPAKHQAVPGPGLSFAEASDLVAALAASPRVVALEICEYAPDIDPGLATARRLVELVTRAAARHLK
jgi:arginase